jgi:Fe2+ transport system protein FeoA
MSSTLLAFSSDRAGSKRTRPTRVGRVVHDPPAPPQDPPLRPLTAMAEREIGVVVEVRAASEGRADRLLALGVTPGARVTMLQRFPGIVFLCDQTELAVERAVADAIVVRLLEKHS